ncbi:MAG: hypothetical protein MSA88_06825 [[Pasteurella] aerogenes]|nr:hypothetical protein [[Pasteurella] aerogenes]
MAITPIYQDKLKQVGCGGSNDVSATQIIKAIQSASDADKAELQKEIVNLLKGSEIDTTSEINSIKNVLNNTVDIQDFAGKTSFKAFPA